MIGENILQIKKRVSLACARSGTDPSSVVIVAVSKTRTPEEVGEAIEAGIADIGENRVQEAVSKFKALCDARYALRVQWHMVGHLQTNKAKEAVRIFGLIQSVDSLRLAAAIDAQAAAINKVQDVLLEVNVSGEQSKYGFRQQEAAEAAKEISRLQHINIKGLMTVAPIVDIPEKTRPHFRMLKELLNEINEQNELHKLNVLSMGMSDDFEVALEEGATMVRIGRAIFGE